MRRRGVRGSTIRTDSDLVNPIHNGRIGRHSAMMNVSHVQDIEYLCEKEGRELRYELDGKRQSRVGRVMMRSMVMMINVGWPGLKQVRRWGGDSPE